MKRSIKIWVQSRNGRVLAKIRSTEGNFSCETIFAPWKTESLEQQVIGYERKICFTGFCGNLDKLEEGKNYRIKLGWCRGHALEKQMVVFNNFKLVSKEPMLKFYHKDLKKGEK